MGRRITIVMGVLLCLVCLPVQGQDKQPSAPSKEDPALVPLPQITPSQPIEAGPVPDPLPASAPALEPGRSGGGLPTIDAAPSAVNDPLSAAPKATPSTSGKKRTAAQNGRGESPLQDRQVMQTEGPAKIAEPHPSAAPAPGGLVPHAADPASPPAGHGSEGPLEGSGFVLPADRLPLGKQEVMLSVDVQAPANLIYNRVATVKIIVRNSGSADAQGVVVRDELPAGLEYVDAQPGADRVGPLCNWRISTLQAGSERVIVLNVKPSKQGGAVDHAATVTFLAGSKATSRILRPMLKLDVVQAPAEGKVLKNKTAEFRISITNSGNGPAHNVIVQAKLSPGLRHETGERNEDNSFELPIQELGPGQREDLDSLTVDALQGGQQWCKVSAKSPDVDFEKESAEVSRTIEVVEPKLKMTLTGPDKRFTDTIAPYTISLENPGTAAAKNIKILATLGVSGRLVAVPPGARYDSASRRLQWTVPQIDPNEKAVALPFEVRMGGISAYEINVEARGDNGLYVKDRRITDVQGMPDVDLVVRERRRVVDKGGTTTFQIRLRNYGTKEATNIQLRAELSNNLIVEETAGGPDQPAMKSPAGDKVNWPAIEKLGPGKEIILGVKVKVTKSQPKIGTCRVFVVHDDLPEPLEDMAGVKVTESARAAITGP